MFSASWREHLQHLDSILSALEEEELFCNASKCPFAVREVKFFGGIVVTAETIPSDLEKHKLSAVSKWPVPRPVKDVRRSLPSLIISDAKFVWGAAHQEAFEQLRTRLLEAPVLGLADIRTRPSANFRRNVIRPSAPRCFRLIIVVRSSTLDCIC